MEHILKLMGIRGFSWSSSQGRSHLAHGPPKILNLLHNIHSKKIQAPSKIYNRPRHLLRRYKLCLTGKASSQIK